MTPRKDSLPHETRTSAEPRQNKLYTVRLAHIEQINPSVRLLRLLLPAEEPLDEEAASDGQAQEAFSFLPGQWLDVHVPDIPQAGGFTITSTPADAQPLPVPEPTVIQDGTEELFHQQGEFGVPSAGSVGRFPYIELAVQDSPTNPPAAWLWKPPTEILNSDLRVRVGGSFVWPPSSVPLNQIHKVVFIAGGVGINPLISILSHLTEPNPTPTVPLPGKSPSNPLHIQFLYTTRLPARADSEVQQTTTPAPNETTLQQVLFLPRLRSIVQRIANMKQPANTRITLELFFSNVSSAAASQAAEILNQTNDTNKINDGAIRVHGRRINKDDLIRATTSPHHNQNDTDSTTDGTVCYVCGPPPMTDEFVQYLEGVMGKEKVLYEKWW